MVSDPFQILTTTLPASSGDTFGSTPLADSSNLGRYTMLSTNTNPNPLEMMITTTPPFYSSFDVVLYQASGAQLFWMEVDSRGVFVGTLEQQGSLTGIPAMKKHLTANDIPHPAETGRQILTKRASTATPETKLLRNIKTTTAGLVGPAFPFVELVRRSRFDRQTRISKTRISSRLSTHHSGGSAALFEPQFQTASTNSLKP